MFRWRKLGQLFNPTEVSTSPWMHEYGQSPSVLIGDNYLRIYFCTRAPADPNGRFVSRIAYIDVKRDNLFTILRISESPVLTLGARGAFDEFGTNPVSVIRHGDEIRAYYCGWTRCETVPFNAAIGVATSKDGGESFQRIGPGPILSYAPEEPFVVGSPRIRRFNNLWYLHYAAGKQWIRTDGRPEPVYKIRSAISRDGLNWSKQGRDLIENRLEDNECQAGAEIVFHDGLYHMFFSYRYNLAFRAPGRGYRIGYAYSNDLQNWTRQDECAGIDVSPDGWDSEMVSYCNVFSLDGNMFMLYQGNEVGRYGFGLAQLESYRAQRVAV